MSQPRTISKGRALYDFAGNADQRQLTFKAGDIINITNQFDNGWWAGELNGAVGYLPATYVQLITAGDPRSPAGPATPGARPNGVGAPAGPRPGSAYGAAPALSPGGARPSPATPAGRPALGSAGSGIGGAAGGPPTPAAGGRPPLSSGGSGIGSPVPAARPVYAAPAQATPPAAAARPPQPGAGAPPPAQATPPPTASRPPLSTNAGPTPPQAASRPQLERSAPKPTPLTPADRGRAATLRAPVAEASDVSDADIKELDQLLSKLQSDVIDLKKLM